jgi:hypothetical protein
VLAQQKAFEVSRLSPLELAVLNGTAPADSAITIGDLENKISEVSWCCKSSQLLSFLPPRVD